MLLSQIACLTKVSIGSFLPKDITSFFNPLSPPPPLPYPSVIRNTFFIFINCSNFKLKVLNRSSNQKGNLVVQEGDQFYTFKLGRLAIGRINIGQFRISTWSFKCIPTENSQFLQRMKKAISEFPITSMIGYY